MEKANCSRPWASGWGRKLLCSTEDVPISIFLPSGSGHLPRPRREHVSVQGSLRASSAATTHSGSQTFPSPWAPWCWGPASPSRTCVFGSAPTDPTALNRQRQHPAFHGPEFHGDAGNTQVSNVRTPMSRWTRLHNPSSQDRLFVGHARSQDATDLQIVVKLCKIWNECSLHYLLKQKCASLWIFRFLEGFHSFPPLTFFVTARFLRLLPRTSGYYS